MSKNWNGAKWIRRERRLAIYIRDGLACVWCGSSLEDEGVTLSLDHVVPVSRGGKNASRNLVTSCRKCNSVRGDRPLEEFACAVASYLNRGITAQNVIDHVLYCARRPADMRAALHIISKRASWQQALEEAKENESRKEVQSA
jgi:hypothetical protein